MRDIRVALNAYGAFTDRFYRIVNGAAVNDEKKLLGWESQYTQFNRFKALHDLAKKYLSLKHNDSVLDAGCGYGALLEYFLSKNCDYKYVGVDVSHLYIQEASRKFSFANFFVCDLLALPTEQLGMYDVVFLSGILNLNIDEIAGKGSTVQVIEFVLKHLVQVAKKGMVCNFLHARSSNKDNTFGYYDPVKFIEHLTQKGFTIMGMKDDYLENDFSLVLAPLEQKHKKNNVTIYTDGGCRGNPGPGAWAFYVPHQDFSRSGSEIYTTNNRMELMATISALRWAIEQKYHNIVLYTDSQYVKNGITSWLPNWIRNNWKTSKKTDVLNRDLWEILYALTKPIHVEWQWVKGHTGEEYNEICDKIVSAKMNAITDTDTKNPYRS